MLGKVVSRHKDFAKVLIFCEKAGEGDMHHCGACGHGSNKKLEQVVLMKNKPDAATGQTVEFELEENARIKAGAMLLLFPLIIFITIAGIVTSLNMKTWLILLISFSSLVITFTLLKIVLKNKTYYFISSVKGK